MWEDTFFVSTTRSIQALLVVFKKVVVKGPLIREIGYFQSNLYLHWCVDISYVTKCLTAKKEKVAIHSVVHNYICLNFKKIAIYTLIKENLSGKELPIVNKGLDGSRWTFQPQKWIYVKLSKAVLWSAYVI